MRLVRRRSLPIALLCAIVLGSVALANAAQAQSASPASPEKPAKKSKRPAKPVSKKPVDSAAPIDVGNPRQAQADQTAERDRLTARIASLKQQIAAGERSRSGAAAALKRAERELAAVNGRLAELARRQREGQDRIAGLDRQRTGTESQITARQAAFGRTSVMFATNAERQPLQLFLSGMDPGEPTLTAIDLGYAARAQAANIDQLHARARDLQTQRQRADDDYRTLLAQEETQRSARDAIAATQAAQQKTLVDLSRQLAEQRGVAAALADDEKRLTRVVEQLQRAIDRQAAEEKARRETARRQAEQKAARKEAGAAPKSRDAARDPAPTAIDQTPEETVVNGAFAQLRGQLRLPVRGTLTGRYGAPRGTSGATWKGVFIRAETGADVHAVAPGKVVFADDLRGFGNLVIIDHGDQYLSIYGNNQTVQKRSGDVVRAGEVIAKAGNSGSDDQTGLYFELRFRGQPFDPMAWASTR